LHHERHRQVDGYGGPAAVEVQDGSHDVAVANNVISGSLAHGSSSPVGILLTSHSGEAGVYDVAVRGDTITDAVIGINVGSGKMVVAEYPRDVSISGNAIRVGPAFDTNNYGV
jgi:hypothetical protein